MLAQDSAPGPNNEPHLTRLYPFTYLRGIKRSSKWLIPIYVWDILWRPLIGRRLRQDRLPVPSVLAVGCAGHLGDVLIMTDVLWQLKRALQCRIILVGVKSNEELARILCRSGMIDGFVEYTHWRLNRGSEMALKKWWRHIHTFWRAARLLRSHGCECFVDLRPYWPNAHLLGGLSGARHNVGFGLRGLSFALNASLPYTPGEALGEQYNQTLKLFGFPAGRYEGPVFTPELRAVCSAAAEIPLPRRRYWVIHPFSGEAARQTQAEVWLALVGELLTRFDDVEVVMVGASAERGRVAQDLSHAFGAKVKDLIGKTRLVDVLNLCLGSIGALTVDSFVAHAAVGARKPVYVLDNLGEGTRMSFPSEGVTFVKLPGRSVDEVVKEFGLGLAELERRRVQQ